MNKMINKFFLMISLIGINYNLCNKDIIELSDALCREGTGCAIIIKDFLKKILENCCKNNGKIELKKIKKNYNEENYKLIISLANSLVSYGESKDYRKYDVKYLMKSNLRRLLDDEEFKNKINYNNVNFFFNLISFGQTNNNSQYKIDNFVEIFVDTIYHYCYLEWKSKINILI